MQLAKPALDVGLYTNQLEPMLAFWQRQAGVPFAELLKLGNGLHQHRHAIDDSVLKINHAREPVPSSTASGLHRLELFRDDIDTPIDLLDPDQNAVRLSPKTPHTAHNLCLHMRANDPEAAAHFYGEVLELPGNLHNGFQVGRSVIRFSAGRIDEVERSAVGFRYLTLQVFDVVATHPQILERGGRQGMAPIRLGEVAYISFVRDSDGNWIEISQRKSLTGSLD